jgi:hypothetical protein
MGRSPLSSVTIFATEPRAAVLLAKVKESYSTFFIPELNLCLATVHHKQELDHFVEFGR